MTENDIHKSADQILEELFSTLGEPAIAVASDPSSVPNNETSVIKIDTGKSFYYKFQKIMITPSWVVPWSFMCPSLSRGVLNSSPFVKHVTVLEKADFYTQWQSRKLRWQSDYTVTWRINKVFTVFRDLQCQIGSAWSIVQSSFKELFRFFFVVSPDMKSTTSEKKKKKKKEKKKSKKKKRKKGDVSGDDDDKRSHEKEKEKKKKKKKGDSALTKVSGKDTKAKVDPEVKSTEEVTKQHDTKKDAKRDVTPKVVKEVAKKDAKSEAKPHAKDEAKKVAKSDVKVSVRPDRSHAGDRRKRSVEPKESRRIYPVTKRRKSRSRSRSPVARRNHLSRRSRSRTPPRRTRRPRSRSRSRSPYHRKRSRSPIVLKRPVTPPKSPKIDKAQLLEFAKQNLKRMQVTVVS